MTSTRSSSVNVWVCLDTLPNFSQRFLRLLFPQPDVLQVTILLRDHGWRRPRGRRRISWLYAVCTDLNLPVSDALNLALDPALWPAGFRDIRTMMTMMMMMMNLELRLSGK